MLRIKIGSSEANMIVLLLIITLVMLGMMYSGIFTLAAFGINCILFAVLPIEMVISDLFFLLPFATVYKYTPASISFVTLLLVFVVLVWAFKHRFVFPQGGYLLLGLAFICFIFTVDLLQGRISINNIFRNVSGIFLLYFILFFVDQEDMQKSMRYTSYGVYLSSFIALFADQIPNFYVYIRKVGYNIYIRNRFSGMNGDPNYYTIFLTLVLLGALAMQKDNKLYFWCSLGLTAFFGIQTYSKSFMIIFCIVLLIILIELFKAPRNRRYIPVLLVLAVLGVRLIQTGRLTSVSLLLRRFQAADNISELTSGRWDIWRAYLTYLFEHPFALLFGCGISSSALPGYGGAHNFLIELLYYIGVVGTLLFIWFIRAGYRIAITGQRGMTLGRYSMIVLMILYMGLQMLFSNELYYHIGYVLMMCMCTAPQVSELEREEIL